MFSLFISLNVYLLHPCHMSLCQQISCGHTTTLHNNCKISKCPGPAVFQSGYSREDLHGDDQGTNFPSRLVRQLRCQFGIKALRAMSYLPQTDGLVEQFNQTLRSMIWKFVANKGWEWDKWLPFLVFAYKKVGHLLQYFPCLTYCTAGQSGIHWTCGSLFGRNKCQRHLLRELCSMFLWRLLKLTVNPCYCLNLCYRSYSIKNCLDLL